jgi:hypothetical protein
VKLRSADHERAVVRVIFPVERVRQRSGEIGDALDRQAADTAPLGQRRRGGEAVRDTFEQMPITLGGLTGPEHRFDAANATYRALMGRADVILALVALPHSAGAPVSDAASGTTGNQDPDPR